MVMLNKVYAGLAGDYKILSRNGQYELHVRNDTEGWTLYDTYDDADKAAADGEELLAAMEATTEYR